MFSWTCRLPNEKMIKSHRALIKLQQALLPGSQENCLNFGGLKKAFCWKFARWMKDILELKDEQPSCGEHLKRLTQRLPFLRVVTVSLTDETRNVLQISALLLFLSPSSLSAMFRPEGPPPRPLI